MKNNCNPYSDLIHEFSDTIWNGLNNLQLAEITSKLTSYNDIYLEIGSGSGNFLINLASANPDKLYVGIELRYKRCVRTVQKAQKLAIQNLLIIREDANLVLPQLLRESISGVYINFPDPWAKKRWLKHRMISIKFLDETSRILKKDGFIKLKTDHSDYYYSSREIFQTHSQFKLQDFSEDLHNSDLKKTNILTEFEQLFQSKQKQIYFVHFTRS